MQRLDNERSKAYSGLDVSEGLSSREVSLSLQIRRRGKDIGTVCQRGGVGAKLAHGLEDELEAVLELSLVGCRESSIPLSHDRYGGTYSRRIATRKQCAHRERAM